MRNHRQADPSVRIFTRESSRAVDTAAVKEFGMPSVILMENAARGVVELALGMLNLPKTNGVRLPSIAIVCGGGNNGGDGFAAARHLHNAGCAVRILVLGEPDSDSDAGVNVAICRKMDLPIASADDLDTLVEHDLIIDAIFGTGLDRPVEGKPADAIRRINDSQVPVLAVDLPSGLDCDAGEELGIAVRATCTASFLGWKQGFLQQESRPFTGRIEVVQIGAPRHLLETHGRRWSP